MEGSSAAREPTRPALPTHRDPGQGKERRPRGVVPGQLENDPAGENYFGRIDCPAIDSLAEEYNGRLEAGESHPADNPTFILDPNRRGGLEDRHPFKALYQQPIDVLKVEFHKHKEAERDRRKQVEAKETTDRLKRLAREASKFMRERLEGGRSARLRRGHPNQEFRREGRWHLTRLHAG